MKRSRQLSSTVLDQLLLLARLLIFSLVALVTACTSSTPKQARNKVPEKNPVVSTVGETLSFDKADLYVKSGEEISLKFVNNASAMKHNFVLVSPGKADEVGIAGIKAGEKYDFVPDSKDVIVHTKLIGKGEETITFKAPPPGDYPFICTNAGHHTVMRGVLHSL